MDLQMGLFITGLVGVIYGVSFAVVPERTQAAPWWRTYVVVGALVVLAVFIVLVVIPFLMS